MSTHFIIKIIRIFSFTPSTQRKCVRFGFLVDLIPIKALIILASIALLKPSAKIRNNSGNRGLPSLSPLGDLKKLEVEPLIRKKKN
jgi:hypothetical protein